KRGESAETGDRRIARLGAVDRAKRSDCAGFVTRHPGAQQRRRGDGRNNSDDRDDDQQFNQRESTVVPHDAFAFGFEGVEQPVRITVSSAVSEDWYVRAPGGLLRRFLEFADERELARNFTRWRRSARPAEWRLSCNRLASSSHVR